MSQCDNKYKFNGQRLKMKFTDLAIGESFQFDDPESDEFRYVRVGENGFKSYPARGITFTLDEKNINFNVKNVGSAFESGLTLHVPAGNFVWRKNDTAIGKTATIEDVINAGFANQARYANMLVLTPSQFHSRIDLVMSVRRINEKTLEFVSDTTNPDKVSSIKVVCGDKFFKIDDRNPGGEIEIVFPRNKPLNQFIYNEERYENAKTLAECEREFLAAKHGKPLTQANNNDLIVTAEAWTDDHNVEIKFVATEWFEQSANEEITELIKCDFGGDYPADAVLEYMNSIGNNDAKELFAYHAIVNKHCEASGRDCIGFECHVDKDSAMQWIEANRPELLAENDSLSLR